MAFYGTFIWTKRNRAMALQAATLDAILTQPAGAAWNVIIAEALAICSQPLKTDKVEAEIARRDRAVADLDQVLASAAWDLWTNFQASVPRTSDRLAAWWQQQIGGEAGVMTCWPFLSGLPRVA